MSRTSKKAVSFVIAFLMAFGVLLGPSSMGSNVVYAAAPVAETPVGTGTVGDPYLIASVGNLLWVQGNPSSWGTGVTAMSYFKQTANLDISSIINWTPIGNASKIGYINYDGGGHWITGLNYSSASATVQNYGFFGYLQAPTIKNLAVIDANINLTGTTTISDIGILAGYVTTSSGKTTYIQDCYTTGTVYTPTTKGYDVGGLLGMVNGASGIISNCYSTANITCKWFSGNLIGTSGVLLYNSFATGALTSSSGTYVGGLIGWAEPNGNVTNCYYVNNIGTEGIGYREGSLTVSNSSNKTLSFFQQLSSIYTSSTNWSSSYPWDFTNTWAIDSTGTINNGLPYLINSQAPALVLSNDATVATKGSNYTVDTNTIVANGTSIATNVTVGTFLGNLTHQTAATWKVVATGTSITDAATFDSATAKLDSDNLAVGDQIAVKAEDGTVKVYAITVTVVSAVVKYIYTVAGTGGYGNTGDGGPATLAKVGDPMGGALDSQGNYYYSDDNFNVIRKIEKTTGIITTIAGNGTTGYLGDGGAAINAEFSAPNSIAIDSSNNIYVSDMNNNRIRKIASVNGSITPNGTITTIAGTGARATSGDGGLATSAQIQTPSGVAVDSLGNVYVSEPSSSKVRIIDATTHFITTLAGSTSGFSGDGGTATSAQIGQGLNITVDKNRNLYIADYYNHRIRVVNSSGIIRTYAGTGGTGYDGDNGLATAAQIGNPVSVAVDASGNVYFTDASHLRMINATTGIISTLAGTGTLGYNGDSIPATTAQLNLPRQVSIDSNGNIYIPDQLNKRIRMVGIPPKSSDATVATKESKYTVDTNTIVASVTPIATNVTVGTFLGNLTHQTAATWKVVATGTNITDAATFDSATAKLDSDNLAVGDQIAVKAEDGTAKVYAITVTVVSSDTTITSKNPKNIQLDSNFPTEIYIYYNSISVNTLISNLTLPDGAKWKVWTADGFTQAYTNNNYDTFLDMFNATSSESGTYTFKAGDGGYLAVLASDGQHVNKYHLNFYPPSTEARLGGLSITPGSLTPALFNKNTLIYTGNIANGVSSIKVTPTATLNYETYETITVNGKEVSSGASSDDVALNEGSNTIIVLVTAQDGTTTKTYNINVTMTPAQVNAPAPTIDNQPVDKTVNQGDEAILSVAATATGTLSYKWYSNSSNSTSGTAITAATESTYSAPTTTAGTTYYYCVVANTDDNATVTKTATITSNVVKVEVKTSPNACDITGWTTPASTTVVGLVATKTVGNATTSAAISVVVSENATWKLYSDAACTNEITNKTMNLNVGANTAYVKVTAEDGVTTKTYTVTITRAVESVVLSNACDVTSWTIPASPTVIGLVATKTVGNATTSAAISVVVSENAIWKLYSDAACTREITNKTIALSVGANTAYVKVTAEDGLTTKTYTVTITRTVESVVLSDACDVISWITPASPTVVGLVATKTVGNTTTGAAISVVVSENATWKLYSDAACTNEITNKTIALSVGANTVYVKVTAEDRTTTKIYTVTIIRTVASVVLSNACGIVSWTTPVSPTVVGLVATKTVENATLSAAISVVVSDKATWKLYSDVACTNEIATRTIKLNVGVNTAYIKVTAEDGVTIKTYTVIMTREAVTSSSGEESTYTTTPVQTTTQTQSQTTIKADVVDDKTGQSVKSVEAKVITEADGTKTVTVKSADAVVVKQADGTKSALTDFSKLSFSKPITLSDTISTGSEKAVSVTIGTDGTIQVKGLANNTESKFSVTYDLGNGEKITIGSMDVKVGSNGEVSLKSTLIDPYGIITDEATGKVINGVNITLYYANTDRNKAAGKTPGTLVPLPGIDGFKPNNNKNPQISDNTGAYGFMVFPTSDYYLVGTKDGYIQYTSHTISVEQEIVKWNFKMHANGAERLFGENRVDTALAIAKATYSNTISNVILTTSENYPDALSGSVLAYKLNAPILLVGGSEVEQDKILAYLKENMDAEGKVYILGGTGAVNQNMETKVTENGFKNIIRLGGANRYETAVKIADTMVVKEGTPMVIVSGENYADALSISSIAAVNQYPILLVSKDEVSDLVKKEISAIKPSKIFIIGLQGAVSSEDEAQVIQIGSVDKDNVVRVGGADRFKTSLEVAKHFNLTGNISCIATGNDFPDALAGSSYAAKNNSSIILVDKSLTDSETAYLQNGKISGVSIFGGEGVVSKDVEQQLAQMFAK